MASTRHRTHVELERLTGIREHHVVRRARGLVHAGARRRARCPGARRLCGRGSRRADRAPASAATSAACGCSSNRRSACRSSRRSALERAISFDLSNACAGMMTGVFILNDMIRQGRIRRGMVVSGEYISDLGLNAAREVRTVMSKQLASLTLGDAGAAAIVERAPEGAPGIEVAGFTTLSKHSRLCLAFPGEDRSRRVDVHRCPGDPQVRDRGLSAAAGRSPRSGRDSLSTTSTTSSRTRPPPGRSRRG